jgi:hypothetical protein
MLILWTPNDQSLLVICAYENFLCAICYFVNERFRYDAGRRKIRRPKGGPIQSAEEGA